MSTDIGNGETAGQRGPAPNLGIGQPSPEERAAAVELLRMISGTHISRAVYLIAELGIPDLLADGPRSTTDLAQATETHEPSLYRVLRLLGSLGVLSEQPHARFGLTVLGERLRSDAAASMRSWARLVDQAGAFAAFEPIIETVRTGRPGFEIARGMPLFEYLSHHPQRAAGFQAAMSERTAALAPSVATTYDFSQMRTVVDVGGGTGTLLAAILQAHGHLRGVLFDLPGVMAAAQATLDAAGVVDRCEVAGGDFFESVPRGADAYLLANVLHDWDDARAVQILGACRGAMGNRGRVLIIERLIADDPAQALPVLLSDMMMLVVPGGQERTNAEYGRLLKDAGLHLGKVRPVAAPYGVIEGLS
jgi:SAM-dependent methyltransferase